MGNEALLTKTKQRPRANAVSGTRPQMGTEPANGSNGPGGSASSARVSGVAHGPAKGTTQGSGGTGDSGISAPFNVRVRTGNQDFLPVQNAGTMQRAFALASPDRKGPALTPVQSSTGEKTGLETEARAQAKEQSGGTAPTSPRKLGATEPSVDKIPIPGVTPDLEQKDPYAAVSTYTTYTGGLLQQGQKHETKIETFARRIENEHVRAMAAKAEWDQLNKTLSENPDSKTKKKAETRKKELEDRLGAKLLDERGVPRGNVWSIIMGTVEERTRVAQLARADADDDIPMIDGVYELARDAKKRVQALTGGRSLAHTDKRLEVKAKKDDTTGMLKHVTRSMNFPEATQTAHRVGLAAREAKLSADRLAVKTKELEVHNAGIDKIITMSMKAGTFVKYVARKGLNAALGMATVSVLQIEQEQVRTEKMNPTGQKSWKVTGVWTRISRECEKAKELFAKKPYGRATSFHVALQLLNVILREARNIIAGIATIVGLAAIAATPLPPLAGALSTASVVLGLIAAAIAAVKVVIGGILFSWSMIRRAISSNARNYNLLNEQIKGQGAEALSDATQVGMSFGAPALANAVGMLGTGAQYLNPVQQLQMGAQGMGLMTHTTVSRTLLMKLGQTAAKTGSTAGSGLATGAVGTVLTGDAETRHSLEEGKRASVKVRATKEDALLPKGIEPGWLKKARESEQSTRSAAIDSLITVHQAKIARFSDRTQALMQKALEAKTASSKAASMATAQHDPEGSAQHAQNITGMLAELAVAAVTSSALLKSGLKKTVDEEAPQIAKEGEIEKQELAGVVFSGEDERGAES
ncbi:MAG: hypothetical protein M0Z40_09420 [Actinomycetota bacterium]|nr:hypothetical protein [Actinomycetota bacterium]